MAQRFRFTCDKGADRLTRRVVRILNGAEDPEQRAREVVEHGCESGIVGELIYYRDTLRFEACYRGEINALIVESMREFGLDSMGALFPEKWDEEDPLGRDTSNRNLMAWFGFEETARRLWQEQGSDAC